METLNRSYTDLLKSIGVIATSAAITSAVTLMLTPAVAPAVVYKTVEAAELKAGQTEFLSSTKPLDMALTANNANHEISAYVHKRVLASLKKGHKAMARGIAKAIQKEASLYGFDPLFLAAVIQNESRFNPFAVGGVGEIGLMQIRPETAEWLTSKMGIKWKGATMLRDYNTNIRIGTFYLSMLREQFGTRRHHYLAAYNMGPSNVEKFIKKKKTPTVYNSRVLGYYVQFYMEMKKDIKTSPERGLELARGL